MWHSWNDRRICHGSQSSRAPWMTRKHPWSAFASRRRSDMRSAQSSAAASAGNESAWGDVTSPTDQVRLDGILYSGAASDMHPVHRLFKLYFNHSTGAEPDGWALRQGQSNPIPEKFQRLSGYRQLRWCRHVETLFPSVHAAATLFRRTGCAELGPVDPERARPILSGRSRTATARS